MRALSGKQPWWFAITNLDKRIDNRGWNTSYRGPILLHASKSVSSAYFGGALRWIADAFGEDVLYKIPPRDRIQMGGIVGRARIVDVIRPWITTLGLSGEREGEPPNAETLSHFYPPGIDHRWHMPEKFGLVLADVEPLPFVPCKGALGLWGCDYDALIRGAA